MVQAVDVFVDSSALVEYIKGKQTDLLDFLMNHRKDLAISNVVVSEFLYYFVGFKGNKSPLTLKRNNSIATVLNQYDPLLILNSFTPLSETNDLSLVTSLMSKHNLLPNDALILTTCLHHSIPYLASYDTNDFATACQAEGITLLDSVATAQQHLTQP